MTDFCMAIIACIYSTYVTGFGNFIVLRNINMKYLCKYNSVIFSSRSMGAGTGDQACV